MTCLKQMYTGNISARGKHGAENCFDRQQRYNFVTDYMTVMGGPLANSSAISTHPSTQYGW